MPRSELNFEEFDALLERLEDLAGSSAAIGVTGAEAGVIARVLEYGSVAGQRPWPRPGPRTIYAVDPETGARVVVSAQAPQGFIRIQAAGIGNRLREELARPADWLDGEALEAHLAAAAANAARAALAAIRDAVPRGSGRLRDNLILLRA